VTKAPHIPLRLHGYAVSNYFNIARAALIEKAADFEIVTARATKDVEFLKASPMGKIPVLQTPRGWVAETVAILEYLEDTLPQPAMYPPDPFLRARGRQIINVIQMYVETPARSLFPGVFFGLRNDEAVAAAARVTLDRATNALRTLMNPAPFLLGSSISHADVFAFYCLDIADRVTRFVHARSILQEIGTLADWSRAMVRRPSTAAVVADFYSSFVTYLANHNAPYDCRRDLEAMLMPPTAALEASTG
jgi:glutathione S-transferase